MYDVDLFETPAATVDALHAQGRARRLLPRAPGPARTCRARRRRLPRPRPRQAARGLAAASAGSTSAAVDVLGPIMERRMDLCRDKGFDAVEPDNVDGYANRSGFPLTRRRPARLQPVARRAPPTRAGCRSGSRTTSTRSPRSSRTSTGRSTSSASSTTSAACSRRSPARARPSSSPSTSSRRPRFCARAEGGRPDGDAQAARPGRAARALLVAPRAGCAKLSRPTHHATGAADVRLRDREPARDRRFPRRARRRLGGTVQPQVPRLDRSRREPLALRPRASGAPARTATASRRRPTSSSPARVACGSATRSATSACGT